MAYLYWEHWEYSTFKGFMSYKNQKDVLLHMSKSKYVQIYIEVIEFLNRHFNSKQFSQPSVIFDDKHHKDAAVTFLFF